MTRINDTVDIPLIDEDQEQDLLLVVVEECAKILQNLFPEDAIKSSSGESLQKELRNSRDW